MSDVQPIQVLDCTLRDGGFYTDWDFSDELVEAYLSAMVDAGVDLVELGYRSMRREGFAGAYRYCEDALVAHWSERSGAKLGVMIDAKELAGAEDHVERLFRPAADSPLELVRIAAGVRHLESAVEQLRRLTDLGYRCGLNLMAWATLDPAKHELVLRTMAESTTEIVYVADSYGGMHPGDFVDVATKYGRISDKPWGVHLHNNLELAFANALEAIHQGARWVDSSVLGMGRGPGNLKTELLLQHLETRLGLSRYHTEPVYDLIGRYWGSLYEAYRWGPSPPYVLSGNLSVHPTFAQRLLGTGRYTMDEVTAVLDTLHRSGKGGSFDEAALDDAISDRHRRLHEDAVTPEDDEPLHSLPPQDWGGREVLIIGRGPSASRHQRALNEYIQRFRPVVIECNYLPFVEPGPDHYCAFILLANVRSLARAALAHGKTVLLGCAGRPKDLGPDVPEPTEQVYWERYEVRKGTLSSDGGLVIPHDVVSMFAINLAARHGARRISLAGFDGYATAVDERGRRMQAELVDFFELLAGRMPDLSLASLLRSDYPVPKRSIYGALFHDEPRGG